jgi:probable F420-dependent oxidoreductase
VLYGLRSEATRASRSDSGASEACNGVYAREMTGFRFGVQASTAGSGAEWRELARRVEGNGYAVLTMPDHFTDQLAPVPALMAAADATTTLRVGALVFDNDYKHPLVLAKELATMDVLSDGRVEVGLGAGWMRTDYDAAGMPFDSNGVRVSRFEEALVVMKGLFSPGPFSFTGTHYTITDYDGLPKPVQKPWPPFLIGGGGPRVLRIAARHADSIGINGTIAHGAVDASALSSMTAAAVDEKVDIVRQAAGDRLADIEFNVRAFFVKVCDDRQTQAEGIGGMIGFTAEQVLESPFALIGTPRQIADDIRARRERWGFTYTIVGAEDVDSFAPVVAELA